MSRLPLVGLVALLLIACGSSEPAGSDPTAAAPDGGAPGERDASGPGPGAGDAGSAVDAATDGATPGVTNSAFDTTLYAVVVVEGTRELAAPAASVAWSAFVNVYDLATTKLVTDAVVKVGVPGDLRTVALQGTRYTLTEFATGDLPRFEVSIARGAAYLHDAQLAAPGVHAFSWTNAADGADSVKHSVTWTPSGNAAVSVNLVGAATPVNVIADSGSHVWTEVGSPTTGTTPVQVVRIVNKAIAPRSATQVVVRVRSKI